MRIFVFALAGLAAIAGCAQAPEDSPDYELANSDVISGEKSKKTRAEDQSGTTTNEPSEPAPAGESQDRTSPLSGAAGAPPRKGTYAIVDDAETTVTATKVEPIDANRNVVTLTTKTAAVVSEIRILLQKTTEGCVAVPSSVSQAVLFFPGNTSAQFRSRDGAGCGLTVTAYATKKGEVTAGTFRGTVDGVGTEEGGRHELEVGFELTRTSDPPPPAPCVKSGAPPGSGTCCSGKAAYAGSMLLCL